MNYKDYVKVADALRVAKDYIQYHETGRNQKSQKETLKIIRHALSPKVAEAAKELDHARRLNIALKKAKQEYYNASYWLMIKNMRNRFKGSNVQEIIDAFSAILFHLLDEVED